MFDIICCEADPGKYGFDKLFFSRSVRIQEAENLEDAAKSRNRKMLLRLRDYAFDEGSVKIIAEKKQICFLIDLGKIIKSRGVSRAIAISKLRNFLALCNRYGAFYTFATFAENENQIRTAEELVHIAMLFDINKGQARFALKMLNHYL